MADHSEVAYTTADGNDYPAHEQTYEGFIMLVKYGTGAVVVIVALPQRPVGGGGPIEICASSGCETGIQLS